MVNGYWLLFVGSINRGNAEGERLKPCFSKPGFLQVLHERLAPTKRFHALIQIGIRRFVLYLFFI